jgi:hypothetical protein
VSLLRKTDEERAEKQRRIDEDRALKQREAEERERRKEQERVAKAEAAAREAFLKTPKGQARTAAEAGDHFFQYMAPLSATTRGAMAVLSGTQDTKRSVAAHTDVLGEIEVEGWRLEDVGYVFEQTGSISRDKLMSSGQTATVTGQIIGVYLFRRTA